MAETLKEKTAKGLFWGAMNNGTMQVIGLVFGIMLGRLLSKEDFGMMAMINIFPLIAIALQNSGFASAIANIKEPKDEDYNSVFWFNIIVGTALYVVLFFCAPLIAAFYDEPRLTWLCRLAFVNLLFASWGTAQNAYLFKNLMVKQQAKGSITATLVSSTVGVTMAWSGFAYWSLAVQSATYVGLNTAFAWHYSRWRPSRHVDFGPVKRMFPFSFKIAATSIATRINENVMNILLGKFYDHAATGSYNQAFQWTSKAYYVPQSMVNAVAQPTLVGLADERERQLNALRKMVRLTAFTTFPLLLGLGLVSHEFIVLALTEKWASSADMLRIVSVAGAVMPFFTLFSNVVITKGRSDIYFWTTVSLSIAQIVTLILIYPLGIHTMIYAYVSLTYVWLFLWFAMVHCFTGYRLLHFLKDTAPFMLAAIAVMTVTHFLTLSIESLWLLLLARIVIAALLYYGVMRVAGAKILDECLAFFLKRKK